MSFRFYNSLNTSVLFALAIILLTMVGCTSRYRMNLFVYNNEGQSKVKVTNTQYYPGSLLGDAFTDAKIVSGDGSVAVITTGFRGKKIDGVEKFGLGLDEYNKYRLFLEFDDVPKPTSFELAGRSFIQLMEKYNLAVEDKIFKPISGACVIDSLHGNKVFCTIDGAYDNHKGEVITMKGRFKFKISW